MAVYFQEFLCEKARQSTSDEGSVIERRLGSERQSRGRLGSSALAGADVDGGGRRDLGGTGSIAKERYGHTAWCYG